MFPGALRLCWDSWWWRSCPWLVWLLHSALKRSSGRSCLLSCPRADEHQQSTSWQLVHSGEEKQQEPMWNQAVYRKYQWNWFSADNKGAKTVFYPHHFSVFGQPLLQLQRQLMKPILDLHRGFTNRNMCHVTSDETKRNTWTISIWVSQWM